MIHKEEKKTPAKKNGLITVKIKTSLKLPPTSCKHLISPELSRANNTTCNLSYNGQHPTLGPILLLLFSNIYLKFGLFCRP